MPRLLIVFHTVIVTARSVIETSPATQITAMHAKPEVRLKVAIGALGIGLDVDVTGDEALVEVVSAWTCVQLKLPLGDCALVICRLRQQD